MSLMPFSHISPHHYVRFLFLVLHYLLRPPPVCSRRPSPLYQLIPIHHLYQLSSISSVSSSWTLRLFGVAGATLPALTWTQPDPVWASLNQPLDHLSICLSTYLFIFFLFIIFLFINLYLHINLSRDLVIFPIRLKNPRAHHPIVHQPCR